VNLRLRAFSRSNEPVCEAAAAETLARGASAIDAVCCAYFAAAGAYPGVLLGSVSLLLGGTGTGDRAFDGRVRQPGKNAKRPRGTLPGQEPPRAARVGVPMSAPALAVAVGYGAQSSLGRLVQHGIALAKERGAERRAAVLARIGEVGALAFSEPEFSRALVRAFGAPNGGLLTPADFARPENVDVSAARAQLDATTVLVAPWADAAETPFVRGAGVVAVDVKGVFCAAVFDCQPEAAPIAELELSAPLVAAPTLRGVPRVSPGLPVNAPAPLEVWCSPSAAKPCGTERRFGIRRSSATRRVEGLALGS